MIRHQKDCSRKTPDITGEMKEEKEGRKPRNLVKTILIGIITSIIIGLIIMTAEMLMFNYYIK